MTSPAGGVAHHPGPGGGTGRGPGRVDEDPGLGRYPPYLGDGVQPAGVGHAQVQDHHPRPQRLGQPDGLGRVPGLPHHLEAPVEAQGQAQDLAQVGMVVGDDHSHGGASGLGYHARRR